MNTKIALSTLVLTLLPMTALTAHANDTAVTNLNHLLKNTKSMTANFSQTTKASGKSQSFSGSMALERGNKFRWDTKSPSEQLIVANGSTMWVYDKDLQQVTKQSVNNQVGDAPALLLSGDLNQITRNFTVSQPSKGKNYYVLKPKSSSANFRDLSISFNGGKPVMMVLNDSIGQTTSIRFSNININKNIPASQFSFTPPKGVDVINQ
ncbi:outer membrane lipoprotein chaperone LolA [Moraxella bovis]|uniref:Outer-membrane lipoprotein carrier protein n=1 Tax=Moraxella bovis TaxID=476 RepID=A0A378PZA3_MORBO|nr:outer membrane lipoprotein chaperone LolA [Moraxella bovis]STY93298.1 Outer-membrane lipoprotein carrier protein precursor [Moraxella bovis]